MSDEKDKKAKPKGIARELVDGAAAARNPGYAAYRREAEAMGEEVLTPEQWAKKKKRGE